MNAEPSKARHPTRFTALAPARGGRSKLAASLLFGALILGFLASIYWPVMVRNGDGVTRSGLPPGLPNASGARPLASLSQSLPRSTLANSLNSPATDIRTDLRMVSDIIKTFRTNFPRGGNPVGNNAEITATLAGRNPLSLSLIPADHAAINADGELCDRWGTPFFFHALSATQMEIRSAGPDRKMWSGDDIVWTD